MVKHDAKWIDHQTPAVDEGPSNNDCDFWCELAEEDDDAELDNDFWHQLVAEDDVVVIDSDQDSELTKYI